MMKTLAELKSRVIDSPVSTLTGALAGAFNLLLHMIAVNVDWTQTRQIVTTAAGTIIPVIVGALVKKVPKLPPEVAEAAQKIADAATSAAQKAAAAATDKVIAEILKLGGVPAEAQPEKETAA